MDYQLLWSDDDLLIVNKPSGLLTIRDGYDPDKPYLSALLQKDYGRVWVVHRLDKDTSGVMLFARNAATHQALNAQFEQHQVRKIYHAIVIGMSEWEEVSISLPLTVDGDRKHRTIIDHQTGKAAQTDVLTLKRLGLFTLLAALPRTGYTHQIRTHLAAIGLPILNDPLYKSLKPETQAMLEARKIAAKLPIHRLALHAYQISFTHPVSGVQMTTQAPYPDDFNQALEAISGSLPA